uniref:Protein NLRC3-like n=1 Tax=Sinocyclocheilus rhinocerous TaxID=307959 RepID=A0A673I4Q4_9TELE
MDRHSHIPWQEYCYLDLKSNAQKRETSKRMEDPGWLRRHQTLLQRFLSTSILVNVVHHMRKADLLSAQEAGLIQEMGSLKDKVHLLVEFLSVTDPHGAALQTYLQSLHLTEYNLITVHDSVVRRYKDALIQRLKEDENSLAQVPGNSNSTLLLIECVSDLQQREHDLVQVSVNRGAGPLHGRVLGLDKLIAPLTRVSTAPRVTLTVGVAGSGKSRMVRRFIQLWSTSQIYPELSLAIPIACWELSSFDRLSVERLLRLFVPYDNMDVILFNESCKVLLILDGLEEFRQSLDFADAPSTSDPRREIPVSDLIANIVRGNLLPGATLWLLSRPGTGAKVPAGLVDRVTEAPPLSRTQIKDYINHCDVSSQVWTYLNSQKPLLILSSVPAVCHVIVTTLSRLLKLDSDATPLPRTLTEVYAHYCWPHLSGSDTPSGSIRKPLSTLGRLAFYSHLRRRYTFSETELRTYGVDVPPQGGMLSCRILQRRQSWSSDSVAWQFTHTSVQEFLGALFYYISSRRGMFDLFSESGVSWPRIGFHSHYRAALQKTNQSDAAAQGNLDLFMRFLSGLLSPAAAALLGGSLGVGHEEQVTQRTTATTLLQNAVTGTGGDAVSMRSVTMVTCLAELQQAEWLRSVEDDLINCSLRGKLKGGVCVVLAYLLQVSDTCTEETQLSNCLDSSSLKRLLPQLLYCSKLRMENNEFKEGTMELLGSLLSAKECHIQMLSLADNSISSKGIKPLSRALLVNRTLTTLDIFTSSYKGAKTLCEALKMNQVLVISSNHLGDLGTVALAQALMVNHVLHTLSLQSNSVSDRGVKALSHTLQSNRGLGCLNLRENSIGVAGAKDIAKALKVNTCLRELDLTANLLHDEGVTAIAEAMRVNRAITSLHLQWNFIKAGAAKALAQSLMSNTCIQLLDLQENALGDNGIIALACALRSNSSLSVLYLQGVSAGKSGAVALADALVVNESLHTLDLRGNSIGMEGAKAFSSALKKNRSLRSLNLQENSLGMDGAIFIATALRGNHQLTYINLQGNGIGESGAKVVSDAIKAGAPDCVVDI